MPIAKVPIYSNPTDSVSLHIEDDIEGFISYLSTRKYIVVESDIGVEELKLSIGVDDPIALSSDMDITPYLFHFYLNFVELALEVDIDVFQNFTEQLIEIEEVDSSDAVGRINNLEMELSTVSTNPQFYKEFSYVDGNISGYTIYSDILKTNPIFIVSFSFVDGLLNTKTVLRVSDGRLLSISYTYTNGLLLSQTRSIS